MGMLDSLFGMGQDNPFAQYQQMQANPFTQQIPGMEYLGGMGQASPGGMPGMGSPDSIGMGVDRTQPEGNGVATDFAGTSTGLPNLPESMQGFGFGQSAPQMNVNSGLRQNLIQELLKQLMGQNMGGGMNQDSGF